jgi:hypothetical protein
MRSYTCFIHILDDLDPLAPDLNQRVYSQFLKICASWRHIAKTVFYDLLEPPRHKLVPLVILDIMIHKVL